MPNDEPLNDSTQDLTKRPFQRILVGLDSSNQASEITKLVAHLAKAFNSNVIVCNVVNVVTSVEGNEVDGSPVTRDERKSHDAIEEMIHKECGDDAAAGQVEIKILHGDPAERIVEYAEFSNSDLIVVGSRGQGALKRALLGSVSSAVVAKTKKSVLIMK